jgi:hypothetical protein
LITGEVQPTTTRRGNGDGMDVDGEEYGNEDEYEEDDEDEDGIIPEMKIVLVGEDQLECEILIPTYVCRYLICWRVSL